MDVMCLKLAAKNGYCLKALLEIARCKASLDCVCPMWLMQAKLTIP